MSTVAYRDGILAADSIGSDLSVKFTHQKLFRLGGFVFGCVGDCSALAEFLNQFRAGKSLAKVKVKGDLTALILTPDGCLYWDAGDEPFPIQDPFFAIGSGAAYAWGAMAMGASAKEAIKIAAKFDPATGLPVRWKRTPRRKGE